MGDLALIISVGVMFGLVAGMAPGPLMTLVIVQTLKYGAGEGLRVSVAPLITDVPIILFSFYIIRTFVHSDAVLALIGFVGALYIMFLAAEAMKTDQLAEMDVHREGSTSSLQMGALVNLLNPHPYIFWSTVGIPFLLRHGDGDIVSPWIFLATFYLFLVGSKASIVLLIEKFSTLLRGRIYPQLMRSLGLLLFGFAVFLIWDSLVRLELL